MFMETPLAARDRSGPGQSPDASIGPHCPDGTLRARMCTERVLRTDPMAAPLVRSPASVAGHWTQREPGRSLAAGAGRPIQHARCGPIGPIHLTRALWARRIPTAAGSSPSFKASATRRHRRRNRSLYRKQSFTDTDPAADVYAGAKCQACRVRVSVTLSEVTISIQSQAMKIGYGRISTRDQTPTPSVTRWPRPAAIRSSSTRPGLTGSPGVPAQWSGSTSRSAPATRSRRLGLLCHPRDLNMPT